MSIRPPKVATIMDVHGRRAAPTLESLRKAEQRVFKSGSSVAPDGRLYVVHQRNPVTGMEIGTPAGKRWQDGKLIPRHQRRFATNAPRGG